jgi:glutathione peroxidase
MTKHRRQASDLSQTPKRKRVLPVIPIFFFALSFCYISLKFPAAVNQETSKQFQVQSRTLHRIGHEITSTSESSSTLPHDSIYRLSVTDQFINQLSLSKFAGKFTMIVNTACKSKNTEAHFKQLAQLHEILEPHGFSIIAFPSNDFHHELPDDESIFAFLQNKFPEISFPIMSLSTLQGNPVYQRLHKHLPNQTINQDFMMYLVNGQGKGIRVYTNDLLSPETISDIQSLVIPLHSAEGNQFSSSRG